MFRQNSGYREMVKSRALNAVDRCLFQSLESRIMLTTVNWDGGPTGNGTDFLTPANWVGDALPLAADTAVIGATGTNPTITISGTPAVQTITSSRNLQLNGGTISGGTLTLTGGASLLTSTSGGIVSSVAVTGDILLNTTSALVLLAGTTTFTTARLSANNAILAMAPGYTLNSLVVSEGAAAGTRRIDLAYGGAGTVTFGPSAVVRLAAGSGAGLLIQNNSFATLVNNGLITAEASAQQILIQNSALTNNGTLRVTAGAMTVQPTNWTNPGTVTGTAGTFNLGGTLNATAGIGTFTTSALTVNVTGTITNTGNTITLNATTGSWNLLGGTINNGSIIETGGSNLLMSATGGALSSVAITGELLLNTTSSIVLLTGTTSFTAARLSANNAILAMAPGYTLNSLVVSEGAAAGTRRIDLAYGGAGTVTFGPSAVVRLAAGSGAGLLIQNNSFATLVNNGLITAEASAQQILIQNSALTNNGTLQALTAGTMSVTVPNVTISGTTSVLNTGILNVDNASGTVTVTPTGNATVSRFRVASLTINGNAAIAVNGSPAQASVVATLNFGAAGKLDLNNNDLIIDYPVAGPSPFTAVQAMIVTARNGGPWDGTSNLASTSARNANPAITTLGALESVEYKSANGGVSSFDGIGIDNSALLIKYTYYGDTDLDGEITFDDYVRIDQGFNQNRSGWLNGDSDLNGIIEFDDYALIDFAFNRQTGVL